MKFSALVGVAVQLATLAAAGPIEARTTEDESFLIYGGFITQKPTGNSYGVWAFYPDSNGNGCNQFNKLGFYFEMDDVSHDQGVACDGEGCLYKEADPKYIDRLEINAYVDWNGHYTWYKNRNGQLVDIHDTVVGTCVPVPDLGHFSCNENQIDAILDLSKANMKSFFRCTSSIHVPM